MADVQTALHQAAAQQDHSQFCTLINHPDFCALEARWRSLRHLTARVSSSRRVIIRLLDLS